MQRPDVGVQDQFSARKPAKTYRYDSSLDPALSWDENRGRELAEWLIGLVQRCATDGEPTVFAQPQVWAGGGVQVQSLKAAADLLQRLSQPFLNWAGKAERHQISVPTVPLFVHERHSTKAILDGIRHRRAKGTTLDLFGDSGLDVTDKLDAYEHKGPWQNRMVLGDSLQVMNSLLEFEGLGGQVQMIYMDPPYGVKFGSNFQPFVRKRDVKHGGDEDMTREPEMVKAYRDTWELGLHSYLTYLRDRLLVAKELLHESGSVFVQISDENLHHVREVMDEVFGSRNFLGIISFKKATGLTSDLIPSICDFILWYGRHRPVIKFRRQFVGQALRDEVKGEFRYVDLGEGKHRALTAEEREDPDRIDTSKLFRTNSAISPGVRANTTGSFTFRGLKFDSGPTRNWKTTIPGMIRLAEVGRLVLQGGATRIYKQFWNDFPFVPLSNAWLDVRSEQDKLYVVQTTPEVIRRCILMATDPGDLVLDPCCGSGTTAFVSEQWGRRWITCDTSRVPLALARQRLLTATFPYYELKNPLAGPQGGFVYKRKQNRKGEEVGGLVPHITLKSIANDEPPATEVLVDRPEVNTGVTRVAGPFVVEATIAPAQVLDDPVADGSTPAEQSLDAALAESDAANGALPLGGAEPAVGYSDPATHIDRMTQVLRQSRTLRLPGNRELALEGIRRADSDVLHAEGVDAEGQRIGIVFGPEDGAIGSELVYEAAREAHYLKFAHLYFFGFAIQAKARELLEDRSKLRIPCTYVTVTPDVAMSDLLKTSRASQIFSVTGLPDAVARKTGSKSDEGTPLWQVELRGLDIFNPATMEQEATEGQNLPAWMLDTDYDGMCFYATQVFFPRTAAWDNLQKSLKSDFDPSVWEHLAGTVSEPFPAGPRRRAAVKVIDERGNELMRVLELSA